MIQIICTALTFFGAVVLLCVNQWFAARHKQTEVLSGKLEELYSLLERIADLGTPITIDARSISEVMTAMRQEAIEALKECKRCSLLIALYFPRLDGRWNSVLATAEELFYEMRDFRDGRNLDYLWDKKIEIREKITEMIQHMTANAGQLTNKIFP